MSSLHEYEFNLELLGESGEYEHEFELASELLEISNEYEFENFLGAIWDGAKRVYNSPQGQAIKKDFISGAKSFGKKMLPSVGRNLGSYFGGSTGADIGGKLAGAASSWLFGEVGEQEAMDYVKVIRKAANYLNRALSAGAWGQPKAMVTQAINQSAKPMIAQRRSSGSSGFSGSQNSGRWIRQGNNLILQGAAF